MLGVVLCGGQSTRMGTDKGLLKFHGISWAETAVENLTSLQLPVVLSVNENQLAEYAAVFPSQQLITDNDTLNIKGPLCAVLSVYLKYPAEDLLVLACDMPLMESGLIKELIAYYSRDAGAAAFVYTISNEPEPLCGIYRSGGLSYIYHLLQANELPRHSMKYMLENIHSEFIPLASDKKKYFRNFNTHAELNGL
jgi:molybdenum cofactor guanylyltransferase